MLTKTFKSINFVLGISTQKNQICFWLFIRFLSATLPLVTIYQFSHLIRLIEDKSDFRTLVFYLFSVFLVRFLDNLLRLRSTTRLDYLISNLSFDIHNYFLVNFKPDNPEDRHTSIQAIRNFGDAAIRTLTSFKQPGIDSVVSLFFIPVALLLVDLRSFIMIITYILTYSFINYYTTQRYRQLRDFQNTKTETYFSKLQDSNDVDLEQATFTRHLRRLTDWSFVEWFFLQNAAVIFYILFLLYQSYMVYSGFKQVSDLILVIGYVSQTQAFLNSFTDIVFGLGDMHVALEHLAKNPSVPVIDLKDLS